MSQSGRTSEQMKAAPKGAWVPEGFGKGVREGGLADSWAAYGGDAEGTEDGSRSRGGADE